MTSGKIIVKILIRKAGAGDYEWTLQAFWKAHLPETQQFRDDLSQRLPQVRLIQFTMIEKRDPEERLRITMTAGPVRNHPSGDGREGGSGSNA